VPMAGQILCPGLSLLLHSLVRKCPSLAPMLAVSRHVFFLLGPPVCKCSSLAQIVSISLFVSPSALFSTCVPFACSDSFHIMTFSSLCTLQWVSTSHWFIIFFPYPDSSPPLHSPGSACLSLSQILFVSPDSTLPLCSPESECPSLTRVASVF
jgi:hypothetical protein